MFFNIIRTKFTHHLRSTKFPEFRKYVSSETKSSGSPADKAESINEQTSFRKSDILKSPNWEQNVSFTLKECILYDIDRRRNNYFDHRLSQTEYNLHNTAINIENKLLMIIVGSTILIIGSVVASDYFNQQKGVKTVRDETKKL
ncbi:uncharacterized protein OCT59_006718 [Rhizophagus irregularis]|uniref:Uncharacterized protein n=1 Tax=Rhizophagus irregularis TaxID=588596 RepID=A0A915YXQ8_9GLOM|nr:hypothetical protein OCT59_006718 [Rhizophagus irregularis]GET58022.1 hypothetical protein GLOIN_2v1841334 [Rhizophagus irregularis DAOM 181602=DAOM 197198]CAB4494180.1 unnamed protein product [Rhizophagus irregularis]CAB5181538.1 unnamed protein product [Rhizophagus irregularis]CAB5351098.1 unnamed protein product [Rhizophagus irregularis]